MASITLTGTLLDPTGEVAVGDQIRFTHRTTTGETIQFARSVLIIPPNGLYNITLEFGLIFVEYLDIKDVNYKSLGVVTVNGETTATDLPGLLNAIVPPTDAQLLLFQGILADTEDARDIALLAAAQQTTLELIASTTTHPNSTVLTLSGHTLPGDGGGGKWQLNGVVGQTQSQSPTQLADFLLNDGNGNQWALVDGVVLAFNAVQYLPLPFGATGNGNYAYNNNDFDKIVDPDRLNPATLAIWQDDTSAQLDDVVTTKERSAGIGGGGAGDVIASGTENGFNIVKHNTLPLSWELRIDSVVDVTQIGADRTGVLASDAAINFGFTLAMTDGFSLYIPTGFYSMESGANFIQTGIVTGDTIRVDIFGDGRYSTIFCSRGAPTHVVKFDGRFVTMRKFAVWGSIDEIRDTTNSAPIGLDLTDFRVGALSDFKIAHIVGSGLKINTCIISHITDGLVNRCGSDTAFAVQQTSATNDGFQASTFKDINIEDSHGLMGAYDWKSHLNSAFTNITFEQQPFFIAELSSPTGIFTKDEAVTFSGGATGFVALSSTAAVDYINPGRGEIIVRDLVGTLATATGTVTTASGSGTVTAVTNSGGRQFNSEGDHGKFDGIWLNQNALRAAGTVEAIIAGDDNVIPNFKFRGEHKGACLDVTGARNSFGNLYLEQNLNDIADEADFDECLNVSGNSNSFETVRTNNSKGVVATGTRTTINFFKTRELYGQAAVLSGANSEIGNIDTLMATYIDGGELDAPHVNLSAANCKVLGGSISAPLSAVDVIQLSGPDTRAYGITILASGSSASVIRSTSLGVRAVAEACTIDDVGAGLKGINLTGTDSKALNNIIKEGGISISLVNDGCIARGNECSGYTVRGVDAQPGTVKQGMIISENTFHDVDGAVNDIALNNNTTNSQILGNNGIRGANSNSLGAGTGNVSDNNI